MSEDAGFEAWLEMLHEEAKKRKESGTWKSSDILEINETFRQKSPSILECLELEDEELGELVSDISDKEIITVEEYEIFCKYYEDTYSFANSKEFVINGSNYTANVLIMSDGNEPDVMNTQIMIVKEDEE